MGTRLVLSLLGFLCLSYVVAQEVNVFSCTLPDNVFDQEDFPYIEDLTDESYEMTAEYTLPGAKQTDYYIENYDALNKMGRLEAHQADEKLTYIYRTDTLEAWNIRGRDCSLTNLTESTTPVMFRDFQTNWVYEVKSDPSLLTIGPSAMFKNAWARWNKTSDKRSMAFLGELPHSHIRGLKARVWRWCQAENVSVDYYFTTEDTDNAYKIKTVPLRVTFYGFREGEGQNVTQQSYDIINFQPIISVGMQPFQLPIGLGCGRAEGINAPDLPILEMGSPVLFWAEVVYRKVTKMKREDISSYYSKIMIATDPLYGNIAYMNSPWNSTLVKGKDGEDDHQEYFQDPPEYMIYDAEQGYGYRINYGTGECVIGRGEDFVPMYRLPENGGDLDLRNPYLFFPNSEFKYLTKGYDRGLKVEVFEAVSEGYLLNIPEQAYRVIASHTYLAGDVRVDNEVSIKNAPVRTEMHILRKADSKVEEILTINFFGYTTKFSSRRQRLFDVSRCFKNDDDYSWVTIGFAIPGDRDNFDVDNTLVEERFLSNMMESEGSELNPTRIPTVLIDLREDLFITFLVLEKPPIQLDFREMEPGKKVDGTEGTGLMTFESCASACIESNSCWGFSLCGTICYMGDGGKVGTVVDSKDCNLYRRYNNDTYMKTKSSIINYWKNNVNERLMKLTVVNTTEDKEVELTAVFIQERDPAEDDKTFDHLGNILSDRMRVLKVGQRLKNGKSLGKLRFDECQRLCLDYQDCETLSYCLLDSRCSISPKYGEEIKKEDVVDDNLCELVTRTYKDHFDVNPGYFMKVGAKKSIKVKDSEACARACLKETGFQCLSVDMCPDDPSGNNCFLHASHFLKRSTRKDSLGTRASCTHHSRKYSVEFKKHIQTRVKGTKVAAITNLDVEECSKRCVDYAHGACYGFDFCQGSTIDSSSCILIDSDPSRLENVYSSVCTQYLRGGAEYTPRPYTTGYAAGIGFLCFIIGGLVGAVVVFVIAYIRVNKR